MNLVQHFELVYCLTCGCVIKGSRWPMFVAKIRLTVSMEVATSTTTMKIPTARRTKSMAVAIFAPCADSVGSGGLMCLVSSTIEQEVIKCKIKAPVAINMANSYIFKLRHLNIYGVSNI